MNVFIDWLNNVDLDFLFDTNLSNRDLHTIRNRGTAHLRKEITVSYFNML